MNNKRSIEEVDWNSSFHWLETWNFPDYFINGGLVMVKDLKWDPELKKYRLPNSVVIELIVVDKESEVDLERGCNKLWYVVEEDIWYSYDCLTIYDDIDYAIENWISKYFVDKFDIDEDEEEIFEPLYFDIVADPAYERNLKIKNILEEI